MKERANFTMADRGSNGLHVDPRTTNITVEDRRSSGLQRNTEAEKAQKTWDNRPKKYSTQENSRQMSRESSVDSYTSEQNCDKNDHCYFAFYENTGKALIQSGLISQQFLPVILRNFFINSNCFECTRLKL